LIDSDPGGGQFVVCGAGNVENIFLGVHSGELVRQRVLRELIAARKGTVGGVGGDCEEVLQDTDLHRTELHRRVCLAVMLLKDREVEM